MSIAKITVYTVQSTGARRNFSSATSNYSNVISNIQMPVFACIYQFSLISCPAFSSYTANKDTSHKRPTKCIIKFFEKCAVNTIDI